jgi:hypothetical protein
MVKQVYLICHLTIRPLSKACELNMQVNDSNKILLVKLLTAKIKTFPSKT